MRQRAVVADWPSAGPHGIPSVRTILHHQNASNIYTVILTNTTHWQSYQDRPFSQQLSPAEPERHLGILLLLQNAPILSCAECRACSLPNLEMSCPPIVDLSRARCHWHGQEVPRDKHKITSHGRDSVGTLARNVRPRPLDHESLYTDTDNMQENTRSSSSSLPCPHETREFSTARPACSVATGNG
jgi:hypothetical protein